MPGNMDFNPKPMPKALEKEFIPKENTQLQRGASRSDLLENYPLEKEFLVFADALSSLDSSPDDVDGKHMEYLTLAQIYPVYKETFGDAAIVPSTIQYRVKTLNQKSFENDLVVLPVVNIGEPTIYINRLNKQLLQAIYVPHMSILNEGSDPDHKNNQPETLNVLQNVRDHEELRVGREGFADEEDLHIFEGREQPIGGDRTTLQGLLVRLLDTKGANDPQVIGLLADYENSTKKEASNSIEANLTLATLYARTERYKDRATELLEEIKKESADAEWDYREDIAELERSIR
jgi:hypothetical protein